MGLFGKKKMELQILILLLKQTHIKKEASVNTNAWLILNEESGVREGDVIALK